MSIATLIRHRMIYYFFVLAALVASTPLFAQAPVSAEIQVRQTASKSDDFLCWTPVKSRIRLLTTSSASDVTVKLKSIRTTTTGGAIGFMAADSDLVTAIPSNAISIVLKKNGDWSEFLVAGLGASSAGKDVAIRAELADGTPIATNNVMVRVRKNAEMLSVGERDALLRALAAWKSKPGQSRPTRFEDFYTAHNDAFNLGIHSNFGNNVSNFLPWHRAFLLNFERELQEIDPTVALPYWKFDEPAPKLFSADFIGDLIGTSTEVRFLQTNPLHGWSRDGQLLRRFKVFANSPALSPTDLDAIICPSNAPTCQNIQGRYRAITDSFELNYHNNAHGAVQGWLGGGASPGDPLFFLLHANVDRGWAHWQALRNRFAADGSDALSYTPVGIYPGTSGNGPYRRGLYARDQMWPWGKPSNPNDPLSQWLPYSFVFPAAENLPISPSAPPIPAQMIDYLGISALQNELGFCYDDVGFHGQKPN